MKFKYWVILNRKTKVLFWVAVMIDMIMMVYLNYAIQYSDHKLLYIGAILFLIFTSFLLGPGLFAASLMGALIGIYIS